MDADVESLTEGLAALVPNVRAAMARTLVVPKDAPKADGTKAVLDAATSNYIDNVLAEGFFRNSGDGYVFIDPYVGAAISDETGRPIVFQLPVAMPKKGDAFERRTPPPGAGPSLDEFGNPKVLGQ